MMLMCRCLRVADNEPSITAALEGQAVRSQGRSNTMLEAVN